MAFFRRRRGLSQTEFAERLGRSESWVSQVERGVRSVDRLSMLERIANELGVSVDELRSEETSEEEVSLAVPGYVDDLRAVLSGPPSGAAVVELAASNPLVGRVLHLVELMLEGDEDIDWGAGYSALEAIEHDLGARKVDGHAHGWWTNRERRDFRKTANSAEALGVRARHGRPGGVAEPHMSYSKASWYVRRVTAHWLIYLLDGGAPAS